MNSLLINLLIVWRLFYHSFFLGLVELYKIKKINLQLITYTTYTSLRSVVAEKLTDTDYKN